MTEFFKNLEARRNSYLRTYNQKIAVGSELGFLAMEALIKFGCDPTSIAEYEPTLGGAFVGALVMAATIELHEKHNQSGPPEF